MRALHGRAPLRQARGSRCAWLAWKKPRLRDWRAIATSRLSRRQWDTVFNARYLACSTGRTPSPVAILGQHRWGTFWSRYMMSAGAHRRPRSAHCMHAQTSVMHMAASASKSSHGPAVIPNASSYSIVQELNLREIGQGFCAWLDGMMCSSSMSVTGANPLRSAVHARDAPCSMFDA